jgi:hypothetical protein
MNTGLSVRAWNDAAIALRDDDGYANATAMCQANGKHLPHYLSNQRTKDYVQALAASLDLTPADLVITTTTGPNEFRGTWIHPRLAVDLARWISPEFAVWMDGWFLEQLEQQPQAPGLTAEDVARIAMEAVNTLKPFHSPRVKHRSPRRVAFDNHAIGDTDDCLHLDLMRAIQRISQRVGRISWRDFHANSGRARRRDTEPSQWLAAIRDLQRIGAGTIETGARGAAYYKASASIANPAGQLTLPPILHIDQSQLTLMDTIRQCAAQAGGPITWHDVMDRYEVDSWPGVGRVWEAMEDLAARGVGTFTRDLQTFRLAA